MIVRSSFSFSTIYSLCLESRLLRYLRRRLEILFDTRLTAAVHKVYFKHEGFFRIKTFSEASQGGRIPVMHTPSSLY
jgi:hypothetical protein